MPLLPVCASARRRLVALTCLGLVALASCGGNVSRVSVFQPTRMVSFGDDVSTIGTNGTATDGKKYSINQFKVDASGAAVSPNVIDCKSSPIWNQVLANSFAFTFAQCNPDGATTFTADMLAVPGATVTDVEAQVAAYALAKGFDAKVLVTVMAGLNDVLQAYTTYKTQAALPGATDADKVAALATATATLQDAGLRLGKLVNGITNEGKGGRVIYATTPDLGLSPLASKDEVVTPGSSKILTDLTFAFNERFRVTVQNDGRYAGLVAADEVVQVMFKNPSSYSLVNISSGGCTALLPDCTPATLNDATTATDGTVTLGAPGVYLWADDTRPGSNWHSRVGGAADSRARNNPF